MSENTVFSSKSLIGQVLQGNYLIEKAVGKGGMAWVYRARHTKLQEMMAVKVLLPHIAEEVGVRKRFLDEARIQFRLKHPNIVQVTDVIEENEVIGIVMEWIEGEDLKELLKRVRSPMPIKDIWRLMAPVLDAMGYAHSRGLIHRDLKPANIMLHAPGGDIIVPKVTDFGIAKLIDEAEESHTRTGVAMGTIKYMAPEQILDSKHVDARADIYSLGVILYFMATARLPFKGDSQLVIYQQLNEPAPPPSSHYEGISPAFEKVLLRCLERDREKRFQSCAELSHGLSMALLESSGVREGSTGTLSSAELQEIMRSLNDSDSSASFSGSGVSLSNLSGESSFMLRARPTGIEVTQGMGSPNLEAELDIPQEPSDPGKGKRDHTFSSSANVNAKKGGAAPKPKAAQPQTINQQLGSPEEATILADDLTSIRQPGNKGVWMMVAIFLLVGLGGGLWFYAGTTPAPLKPTPDRRGTEPAARQQAPIPALPSGPCKDGDRQPCYDGLAGTQERAPCQGGLRICKDGKYGRCMGQILPSKELCNDKDDDCDGKVDEDFEKKAQSCAIRDGDCAISGVYACSEDGRKLRCLTKAGGQSEGVYRVRLKFSPPSAQVMLRYGGNKRKAKGQFCVEVKERVRLNVDAGGFYACAFTLPTQNTTVQVRLKRRNPMDLDPSLGYCKR